MTLPSFLGSCRLGPLRDVQHAGSKGSERSRAQALETVLSLALLGGLFCVITDHTLETTTTAARLALLKLSVLPPNEGTECGCKLTSFTVMQYCSWLLNCVVAIRWRLL